MILRIRFLHIFVVQVVAAHLRRGVNIRRGREGGRLKTIKIGGSQDTETRSVVCVTITARSVVPQLRRRENAQRKCRTVSPTQISHMCTYYDSRKNTSLSFSLISACSCFHLRTTQHAPQCGTAMPPCPPLFLPAQGRAPGQTTARRARAQ